MRAEDLPRFPHHEAALALNNAAARGHSMSHAHPQKSGSTFIWYCEDGCEAYLRLTTTLDIVPAKLTGTATKKNHPYTFQPRRKKT
jgi:hypothetical protein